MINSLFSIVIYSTISIFSFSIMWFILKNCLTLSGNSFFSYNIFKIASVLSFLPMLYLFRSIRSYKLFGEKSGLYIWGDNKRVKIILIVWVIGVIFIVTNNLIKYIKFNRLIRSCYKVPIYKKDMLERVKGELGIKKDIQLKEGYHIISPFIYGIIKPVIYLPEGKELDDYLEDILMHELIHYKQKDTLFRIIFVIEASISWYNPFGWYLFKELKEYAEFSCDYRCCNNKNVYKYFEAMFCVLEGKRNTAIFAPMWIENQKLIKKRVKKMKRKSGNIVTCALLVLGLFGGSTCIGVYTANAFESTSMKMEVSCVKKVDDDTYITALGNQYTIEENEKIIELDEKQVSIEEFEERCDVIDLPEKSWKKEACESVESFGWVMKMTPSIKSEYYNYNDRIFPFGWSVPNNTIVRSSYFSASSGEKIIVNITIGPENRTISYGIYQPDGTCRYVNASGNGFHTFTLTQTGSYRFVVKNQSGVTVECGGTWKIS